MPIPVEDFTYIRPLDTPIGTQEDNSRILGTISTFLDYLTRPSKALWGGVYNLTDENPNTGFWEGAHKGLMGESDKELADVVRIGRAQENQDWPEWLLRTVAHFAVNAAGDPLTYAFMPVKGATVAGKGLQTLAKLKEGQSLAGKAGELVGMPQAISKIGDVTGLRKAFARSSGNPDVDLAVESMGRRIAEQRKPIMGAMAAAKKAEEEALKNMPEGTSVLDLRQMLERTPEQLPDNLRKAWWAQEDLTNKLRQDLNELRKARGMDPIKEITEGVDLETWVPRLMTRMSRSKINDFMRANERIAKPEDFTSIQLRRAIDPKTGEVIRNKAGLPVITKPEFLKSSEVPGSRTFGGRNVELQLPTLKEIEEGIPNLVGAFAHSPTESYAADAIRKVNMSNFLQTIEELIGSGKLKPFTAEDIIPKGMRRLKEIKGLEEFAAPKAVADYLVNVARGRFDPTIQGSWIHQIADIALQSQPGQVATALTSNLKKNLLALRPGFYTGNVGSNQVMSWMYGDINPAMIPVRDFQAAKMQFGRGNSPLEGFTNAQLREAAETRDVLAKGTWAASEAESGYLDNLAEGLGKVAAETTTETVFKTGDVVKALDKNNFGKIVRTTETGAHVHFVNPETKAEATIFLPWNKIKKTALTSQQYAGNLADDLAKAIKGKGFTQQIIDMIPEEKIGETGKKIVDWIPKAGEAWSKVLEWPLRHIGGNVEANSRGAVFIDWLMKNAPDIAKRAPKEQARLLDQAAMHAKRALIDYSKVASPVDRAMSLVDPFWKWDLGSSRLGAMLTATNPAKVGRLDRALNTVFEGMNPEDRAVADQWMIENLPTMGIFGHRYQEKEGMPGMRLVGRFLPTNTLESLVNRPLDTLTSKTNPYLKGPINLARNRDEFKDRDIDVTGKISGGPWLGQPALDVIGGAWQPSSRTDYVLSQSPLSLYYQMAKSMIPGNPYKEEMDLPTLGDWLLTGMKTYPFDRAKAEMRRERELKDVTGALKGMEKYSYRKAGDVTSERAADAAMEAAEKFRELREQIKERSPRWLMIEGGH